MKTSANSKRPAQRSHGCLSFSWRRLLFEPALFHMSTVEFRGLWIKCIRCSRTCLYSFTAYFKSPRLFSFHSPQTHPLIKAVTTRDQVPSMAKEAAASLFLLLIMSPALGTQIFSWSSASVSQKDPNFNILSWFCWISCMRSSGFTGCCGLQYIYVGFQKIFIFYPAKNDKDKVLSYLAPWFKCFSILFLSAEYLNDFLSITRNQTLLVLDAQNHEL